MSLSSNLSSGNIGTSGFNELCEHLWEADKSSKVAPQLVRPALNPLLALTLPLVRSRHSCGQPRVSTLLVARFVLSLRNVSLV